MAPPEAEKIYPSQDGQTLLKVQGHKATILTPDAQEMETFSLRGDCMAAAISNHRLWVAVALDKMFTDICLFQNHEGTWSITTLKRLKAEVDELAWQEADDPRYPPVELIVKIRGGTTERLMPQ